MLIVLIIPLALFLFFVFGCTKPAVHLDIDNISPSEINETIKHHNAFTLRFMKLLDKDSNTFFSPFSIYVVSGMLREGADGKTLSEIDNTLGLNNRTKYVFAYLINTLSQKNSLSLANAMWIDKRANIFSTYKTTLSNHFGTTPYQMDVSNPKQVVKEVNAWADKNTNGRIKKVLNEDDVDASTRLILANAIYFNEEWKKKFEHVDIQKFFVNENESVDVEMMHDEFENISYYQDENWQVVALPYKDEDLEMIVFLPRNKSSLPIVDEETFTNALLNMKKRKMTVFLPKFEFSCSYGLIPLMTKMGIKDLFTSNANLSRMSNDPLFVSKMLQKSFVKVDEKGTEAAAVTVAFVKSLASRVDYFQANHPFLFFIVERKTGLILFAGRVVNPAQGCG